MSHQRSDDGDIQLQSQVAAWLPQHETKFDSEV